MGNLLLSIGNHATWSFTNTTKQLLLTRHGQLSMVSKQFMKIICQIYEEKVSLLMETMQRLLQPCSPKIGELSELTIPSGKSRKLQYHLPTVVSGRVSKTDFQYSQYVTYNNATHRHDGMPMGLLCGLAFSLKVGRPFQSSLHLPRPPSSPLLDTHYTESRKSEIEE